MIQRLDEEDPSKRVVLYTDGGCEPNPGVGGYGTILQFENQVIELSGGFQQTTNNRMEIFAAIAGLEALLTPCEVTLYSDSRYLVDTMSLGWAKRWQSNGWWRAKKERAVNADLWERLLALCERHRVVFEWVRGHAGNEQNERCDVLAMAALKQPNLPPDTGYVSRSEETEPIDIAQEGQPCRVCSTPVVRRVPRSKLKPGQMCFFEYYLECPNCMATYRVEKAKRFVEEAPTLF